MCIPPCSAILFRIMHPGKCETCDKEGEVRVYDGETARNLNIRSKEHIKDFKNNYETSFMLTLLGATYFSPLKERGEGGRHCPPWLNEVKSDLETKNFGFKISNI